MTRFAGVAGVYTAATSTGSPELLEAPEELAMGCKQRGECLLALESGSSLVRCVWSEWQRHEVAGFVEASMGLGADSGICRPNSGLGMSWQVRMSVWRPCGLSEEGVGNGRRAVEVRQWLTQLAEGRPVNEVRRAGFGLK